MHSVFGSAKATQVLNSAMCYSCIKTLAQEADNVLIIHQRPNAQRRFQIFILVFWAPV